MKRKLVIVFLLPIFLFTAGCKKEDFEGKMEGTFTDSRGFVKYRWVRIGDQIWMAENLRATKYNDGTGIHNFTEDWEWRDPDAGAYCWLVNDPANGKTYGALYNWYAVETGKLCPTGWHVPSEDEWQQLVDYVGGEFVAGCKLKARNGWYYANNGTDEYGFTALPAGSRYNSGNFSPLTGWWSVTKDDTDDVWCLLISEEDYVSGYNFSKKFGFPVRCIRD